MHVIPIFFVPLQRQTIKTYKTWQEITKLKTADN